MLIVKKFPFLVLLFCGSCTNPVFSYPTSTLNNEVSSAVSDKSNVVNILVSNNSEAKVQNEPEPKPIISIPEQVKEQTLDKKEESTFSSPSASSPVEEKQPILSISSSSPEVEEKSEQQIFVVNFPDNFIEPGTILPEPEKSGEENAVKVDEKEPIPSASPVKKSEQQIFVVNFPDNFIEPGTVLLEAPSEKAPEKSGEEKTENIEKKESILSISSSPPEVEEKSEQQIFVINFPDNSVQQQAETDPNESPSELMTNPLSEKKSEKLQISVSASAPEPAPEQSEKIETLTLLVPGDDQLQQQLETLAEQVQQQSELELLFSNPEQSSLIVEPVPLAYQVPLSSVQVSSDLQAQVNIPVKSEPESESVKSVGESSDNEIMASEPESVLSNNNEVEEAEIKVNDGENFEAQDQVDVEPVHIIIPISVAVKNGDEEEVVTGLGSKTEEEKISDSIGNSEVNGALSNDDVVQAPVPQASDVKTDGEKTPEAQNQEEIVENEKPLFLAPGIFTMGNPIAALQQLAFPPGEFTFSFATGLIPQNKPGVAGIGNIGAPPLPTPPPTTTTTARPTNTTTPAPPLGVSASGSASTPGASGTSSASGGQGGINASATGTSGTGPNAVSSNSSSGTGPISTGAASPPATGGGGATGGGAGSVNSVHTRQVQPNSQPVIPSFLTDIYYGQMYGPASVIPSSQAGVQTPSSSLTSVYSYLPSSFHSTFPALVANPNVENSIVVTGAPPLDAIGAAANSSIVVTGQEQTETPAGPSFSFAFAMGAVPSDKPNSAPLTCIPSGTTCQTAMNTRPCCSLRPCQIYSSSVLQTLSFGVVGLCP